MSTDLYVVELSAWDPATSSVLTLRYANVGFVTNPTDTPPNTFYDGRLLQPASLRRDLFTSGATSGRSRVSYGDLTLLNQDGALDGLLAYGFDGRQVLIRRGVKGAAYPSAFTLYAELTAEQLEAGQDILVLKIRDRQLELDVPLQPTKYAGDNLLPDGLEGVAGDLAGKPKPRCFGTVQNVPAVLVNTARLIYQVNDGPVASVPAVYDRGIQLTQGRIWVKKLAAMGANGINAVAFGNGVYVAAGAGGALKSSSDGGATWTSRTSTFGASDIYGLTYGGGLFIAVGAAGKLATSPDGATWTARTSGFGADAVRAAIYSAGLALYVAGGDNGKLSTSPDGTTWTARTSGFGGNAITAIAEGAGLLLAFGNGIISSSVTGTTWTVVYQLSFGGETAFDVRGAAYGAGMWVAVGLGENDTMLSSPDGAIWTRLPTPLPGSICYATVYGDRFVVVGAGGSSTELASSTDGVSFLEALTNPFVSITGCVALCWDGTQYAAAGTDGNVWMTASTGYADAADLQSDLLVPLAGEYNAWLDGGYVRLGAPPAGLVTADVTEGATTSARTLARLFARLLSDPLGAPFLPFSSDDVAALDAALPAVLGLWVGAEELTVAQALDRIARSAWAWWGVDRNGVFRIKQFAVPSGTPVAAFTANDLKRSLLRVPIADEGRGIPTWRSIVRHTRNHAVQTTDLAAGVTDAHRAFVGREYREATAEDASVQAAHLLAPQLVEDTLLTTASDAATETARRQALRGVLHDRFEIVVPLNDDTKTLDLFDVVTLTHPRYGLAGGPLLRVLGLEPNVQARELTLQLWK